ncbi:plasmid maintenance system killer protein (plasmid) [Leptospira mayottensis]|nr:plasmid maintenance system killer protein [Leptospira mayottensis]
MEINSKHKGLEQIFETGNRKGIQPDHAGKLGRILDRLDASLNPKDMNLPSFKLHQLKGTRNKSVVCLGKWKLAYHIRI